MTEKLLRDFPSAEQYEKELKRLRSRNRVRQTVMGLVASLLVFSAFVIIITMLCLPVLRVTGSSMVPTLQHNEIVICSRWSDYERGDIIAFNYNNKTLLKRVVGLPGDVIEIDEQGNVSVNGEQLTEPYVEQLALGQCDITFPIEVPANRVFVLGDYREVSVDSRVSMVGCIADEYIIGEVVFRVLPFGQMTLL